jgi:site-specific recombinase XerD
MVQPIRVRVLQPLEPYVEGFWAELLARGYSVLSARNLIRLMAHVSRWLHHHHLQARDLTPRRVEQFLKSRRRAGYTAWLSAHGLEPLLDYLRRLQVVPVPRFRMTQTPGDQLVTRFGNYLRRERDLAEGTIRFYQKVAARFLAKHPHSERFEASDVSRFILQECRTWSISYSKYVVSALRSFLRFLFLEGETRLPLANAAPAVAGWRGSSLPQALKPEDLSRLLRSCDRRTAVGRRDYAVLMLLARLGLRRGEVAALRLEDIDWRRGEITIRGKGNQQDRLPLPTEVGEALVAYLRRGRPRMDCRALFLRVHAPLGALSSSGIAALVLLACHRAHLPHIGAHRLRHSAATHMLQHGASLPEIAQVLRHRSLGTTVIYAKVDRTSLRMLAQPWPGENV